MASLVEALLASKATKLSVLDLQNNDIRAAGLKALAGLLGGVMSFTALSVAGTKMEFTDTEALQTGAKEQPDKGRPKAVRLWTGKENKNFPELHTP